MPIFDPSIPDDFRFDLSRSTIAQVDELTWFLMLFAIQSTDFVYGDTRDAYACWARGKKEALDQIKHLCLQEEYIEGHTPVDGEEAVATVIRFCKKHNLIIST